MRCRSLLIAVLMCASPALFAQDIPAGTIIPVMLTVSVDSAKSHAGQAISGKVMETVPLPEGQVIPEGAKVFGHVALVIPAEGNDPGSLALEFDRIVFRGHDVQVRANLRALASMMTVYDAQVPLFEPDTTPRSAVMLAPVGGDAAFRPDNPEKSWGRMVRFSGELPPGCGGRIDREGGTGALWVFSPYACGVYGFGKSLVIVRDGSAEPVGNILLGAKKNVEVHAGSGWLLRVESRTPASNSATAQ